MRRVRTPIRATSAAARRALKILAVAALLSGPLAVFATAPASSATGPARSASAPARSAVTPSGPDIGISRGIELTSGFANVKGDGYTWHLSIGWVDVFQGQGLILPRNDLAVDVAVERTVAGPGYETHSWSFFAPVSSLTVKPNGYATLNSGTSLDPVAAVDVSFVPAKKTVETGCSGGGSATLYTGALSGTVDLHAGTTPKNLSFLDRVSFATGPNTLSLGTCVRDLCSGTVWSEPSGSPPAGAVEAGGVETYESGKPISLVSLSRETELKLPRGATRDDVAQVEASAARFNARTSSLAVSASGFVSGSGVLTGVRADTSSEPCQISGTGKKYTETVSSYSGARLTAWKAFAAHTSLTGLLTASAKATGGFTIVALK